MTIKLSYHLLTAVLVLGFTSTAHSTVVTFEEVIVSGIGSNGQKAFRHDGYFEDPRPSVLISSGLTFGALPSANNIHVNGADFLDARSYLNFYNNGTNTLSSYSSNGGPAMGMTFTEYFSISSIDFAEYGSTSFPSPLDSLLITGVFADGSTIQKTLVLDGIVDGAGGADDFQTVFFDGLWSGLMAVEIGSDDGPQRNVFGIDNIHYAGSGITNIGYQDYLDVALDPQKPYVASVPEPGTLILLALGLAGISITKRRRK
jgi:hypothetical protein